jgi:hypothetical protein
MQFLHVDMQFFFDMHVRKKMHVDMQLLHIDMHFLYVEMQFLHVDMQFFLH